MAALDGVRTIAVFLVIAFHVSAPRSAAGFIGVDIFFVLSGYLITAGLLREVEKSGRISLGNFWLRRFKRLMPAALLTLLAVTLWMLFFSPLFQQRSVSTDLWWTLLYLANWHLMNANSYFAATGAESPLLHMWSLAVEEQFYVGWPLLLAGALVIVGLMVKHRATEARRVHPASTARTLATATAVLAAALIGISVVLLATLYDPASPDRAYMGTDTKAFEPLLGALAAALLTRPAIKDFLARHHVLLGWAGVVLMVSLFPFLDGPSDFYYTWGALTFCLGALALIIALVLAGEAGFWARVLGWEPVAYLGRISYGLYLWHWPLAVWIIGDLEGFRWLRAMAVVGLTVVAAALSYHLVEMPVRTGKWFTAKRSAAVAVASLAAMLVAVSFGGGTPLSPLLQGSTPVSTLNKSVILTVGDSVPQRFNPVLDEEAGALRLEVASATVGGCAPTGVDVPLYVGKPDVECGAALENQRSAMAQFEPATIVWWSRYELADMRIDGEVVGPEEERFWEAQQQNLEETAARLMADGAVLVFVETDRIGTGVYAQCTPEDCHPFLDRLAHQDQYRQRWNQMVRDYAAEHELARTVVVDDLYCTDDAVPCSDVTDGVPARADGSHFTDPAVQDEIARGVLERILEAADIT
ncbi:acyltransferase [Tessaracoccus sp. OS52]|uniref:acyltransferase family protein n=1 Tax=Tessaracoccus sp. OS52 TaxID=2886691 RepID=UPI001D1141EB|nr:acyltransferase family protein [Tessaracoccus sp. OS52]MCC2593329.1 acyltransferase [Tessaracoccus sp. OS52]